MANDAILVAVSGKPMAQDAIALSNQTRALLSALQSFKLRVDHLNDGATFATLETQVGITAGLGAGLVTLLASMQTALNDASVQNIAYRVQQV